MFLSLLKKHFDSGIVYVRISPRLLSVRSINDGKSLELKPVIALGEGNDTERRILAVGERAISELQANSQPY